MQSLDRVFHHQAVSTYLPQQAGTYQCVLGKVSSSLAKSISEHLWLRFSANRKLDHIDRSTSGYLGLSSLGSWVVARFGKSSWWIFERTEIRPKKLRTSVSVLGLRPTFQHLHFLWVSAESVLSYNKSQKIHLFFQKLAFLRQHVPLMIFEAGQTQFNMAGMRLFILLKSGESSMYTTRK